MTDEPKTTEAQTEEKKKIKSINEDIEKLQIKIQEICKLRDIDLKEVMDGVHDLRAQENYSTKALRGAPRQNEVLRELEQDLENLKAFSSYIWANQRLIDQLERVDRHIAPDKIFELSYDELVQFGF